jgi:hypothetical protein
MNAMVGKFPLAKPPGKPTTLIAHWFNADQERSRDL